MSMSMTRVIGPKAIQAMGPDDKKPPRRTRNPRPKKEDQPFRFLDLPPEVRNMIYKLVLISHLGAMEFRRRLHPRFHWRFQVIRRRQKLHGGKDVFAPRLLETCKQVAQEATAVLYKCNEFQFPTPGHCIGFTRDYAEAMKHIRRVRIKFRSVSSPTVADAFSVLRQMPLLERVDLDWDMKDKYAAVCVPMVVSEFWQSTFHWLQHVARSKGHHLAALDILGMVGPNSETQVEKFFEALRALMEVDDYDSD